MQSLCTTTWRFIEGGNEYVFLQEQDEQEFPQPDLPGALMCSSFEDEAADEAEYVCATPKARSPFEELYNAGRFDELSDRYYAPTCTVTVNGGHLSPGGYGPYKKEVTLDFIAPLYPWQDFLMCTVPPTQIDMPELSCGTCETCCRRWSPLYGCSVKNGAARSCTARPHSFVPTRAGSRGPWSSRYGWIVVKSVIQSIIDA